MSMPNPGTPAGLTCGRWVTRPGGVRVWLSEPDTQYRNGRAGKDGRNEAKCGTDSGYYRHRRQKRELACDECLRAHREAERARAARAKERGAA